MSNDKDSAVADSAMLEALKDAHIIYLLGVRHGRKDERAKIATKASQPTQSDALAKCLAALDDEEVVHAIDCNKVEQRAIWDSALKMCRERITAALRQPTQREEAQATEIETLRAALRSIANSQCCDICNEAKKVAIAALAGNVSTARITLGRQSK